MTLPVVARANHDARLAETLEGTARKKEAAAGPGLLRSPGHCELTKDTFLSTVRANLSRRERPVLRAQHARLSGAAHQTLGVAELAATLDQTRTDRHTADPSSPLRMA